VGVEAVLFRRRSRDVFSGMGCEVKNAMLELEFGDCSFWTEVIVALT